MTSIAVAAMLCSLGKSLTLHKNLMKLFKSITGAAAVAVIASGGMIGFAPAANAGQMMPKQGSCPSGTSSVGGGYCQARDNNQYVPKRGSCPSGASSVGGGYCKALNSSDQYVPKGGSCPSGTSSVGGGYCKVRWVINIGKPDALSLWAESNTKPAREKQGAQVSPSISRQKY